MKKIIYRLISAIIPALPVWIILGNLWVGIFVAFLAYITIHFYQFIIYSTTMATYEYFSHHFVDAETGKKIDAEKLRQIVDADPVYMENLKKSYPKIHLKSGWSNPPHYFWSLISGENSSKGMRQPICSLYLSHIL